MLEQPLSAPAGSKPSIICY